MEHNNYKFDSSNISYYEWFPLLEPNMEDSSSAKKNKKSTNFVHL